MALERAVVIYPGIEAVDWEGLFTDDLDMVGRIIGDVLKLQKAEENPHRRGRRTVPQVAVDEIWQMFEGFSNDPFSVALTNLMRGKSVRQVAIRLHLSHMTLFRLKTGQSSPSLQVIEEIAAIFNKPPHYFLEYRAMVLARALEQRLTDEPTLSVALFKSVLQAGLK